MTPTSSRSDRRSRVALGATRALASSLVALLGLSLGACTRSPPASDAAARAARTSAGEQSATRLGVSRVVLFSSGVGYFEHAGVINGPILSALTIRSAQLDDVLKSLVIEDRDGGHVGLVEYPSLEPLSRILASFQVNLSADTSLERLLGSLRGSPVTVTLPGRSLHGTIFGTEDREQPLGSAERVLHQCYLQLREGIALHEVPLDEVQELHFDDAQVQHELVTALDAIAQARQGDRKTLTIDFVGSGTRRVRYGYVMQAPIWKTSYRLVLPPPSGALAGLQGWAIIENESADDWSGIPMSLVSGRPLSFIQQLSRPLYHQRPVVEPDAAIALAPTASDDAVLHLAAGDERTSRAGLRAGGGIRRAQAAQAMDITRSIQQLADASSLDSRTVFTVPSVHVPRQRSAMIPILTAQLSAQRVSIFNRATLGTHPLSGVLLTNSSDKDLLQGPMSVFDGVGYLGDAMLDNLPPGDHRLLSYALDLAVAADTTTSALEQKITEASLSGGRLLLTVRLLRNISYRFENHSQEPRLLVIEHPRSESWSLCATETPMEQTSQLYRWKAVLPALGVTTLTIHEENLQQESLSADGVTSDSLELISRDGALPAAIRQALHQLIGIRGALAQLQRTQAATRTAIASLTADQARLRLTVGALDPNSAFSQRLLTRLDVQETALEALQSRLDAGERRQLVLQRQLERCLELQPGP